MNTADAHVAIPRTRPAGRHPRWRRTALLPLAGVLACACDGGAELPAGNEIVPSEVEVGDTVAGLRVAAVRDLHTLADDSSVWSGTVRFEGELELAGVYQPHFDYPDVPALCFHPDTATARRIPRFAPDARTQPDRKRWLCFRNPDAARAAFEPVDAPREAVIVVRDYTVNRYFTDAWDEAELVRVVETRRPREATLREPPAQPAVGAGRD